MKKIIYLKVDENKNAEVLKPDSMEAKECISLMLGAAVWYYSTPQMLFSVSRGSFLPAPAVDSAVIRLDLPEVLPPDTPPKEDFFRVVRAGFGQRRKTLLNSLSAGLGLGKEELRGLLAAAELPEGARAEQLTLSQWQTLAGLYARRAG